MPADYARRIECMRMAFETVVGLRPWPAPVERYCRRRTIIRLIVILVVYSIKYAAPHLLPRTFTIKIGNEVERVRITKSGYNRMTADSFKRRIASIGDSIVRTFIHIYSWYVRNTGR